MIKKTFFIFVCSFFLLKAPLGAEPSIFEAMRAFEAGEDERARNLFRPFLKGTPVARPYCERLIPDELPPQEDVFKGRTSSLTEDAKGWFTVSLALRQINESHDDGEKESAYRKLLKIYKNQKHPAAGYACSHLAETLNGLQQGPADEMFLTEFIMARTQLPKAKLRRLLSDPSQKSSFLKTAIEEGHGVGMGIKNLDKDKKVRKLSDPRSYLAIVNVPCLRISFGDETNLVDLVPRAKVLQLQLAKKTESDAFCDLAKLFSRQKLPELASQFIFMAGLFGSSAAQLTMAEEELSEGTKLYWISQGSEKEDIWALEKAVEAFKVEPLRQIPYLKRLLQAGALKHTHKYFDLLKSYNRLEEAAEVIALMLAHEDKLIPEGAAFRFMKIFEQLPRESTRIYRDSMFNYLKKHSNSDSYLLRGFLLAEHTSETPLIDEEFSGDFYKHFAKAEELGEPGGAYQFGFYKEKEEKAEEALEAYERAIKNGLTMAAGRAGKLLMDKNNPEDDAKAFKYLTLAYNSSNDNYTPYVAYNLAMLHIYERGGASLETARIHEYLDKAMSNPNLRDAAACEKGLYMFRKSLDIQGLNYILLGVENDYPSSLMYAGQILLLNEIGQDIQHRQYGLDCIKRAMSIQAPGAKVIYALLLLSGMEDLLESNQEEAQRLITTFSAQEKQDYLEALEMFKVVLATEEESSPTVVETQPELKKEREAEPEEPVVAKAIEEKKTTAPVLSSTEIKIQRLHAEIEEMMGKKQVKWRKVQSLMGKIINLTSGSFSPATGGGSGHHGMINNVPVHLHLAHGKGHNPTELTGGRLEAVLAALKEASNKPSAKDKKRE